MRCFIPATDDELYAFIERYGVEALVPYRVGMTARRPAEPLPVLAEIAIACVREGPRLAA